jgi:hypothetical protein
MSARFGRNAACLIATLALSACITTTNAPVAPKITPSESPWLEASPVLKMQIQDQADRLPWTHGVERVEAVSWFAQVGEPAYPVLLKMCTDPRPEVAGCAFAALGATGDQRLVPYLLEIDVQKDQSESLRYERARTLVRLGDWTTIGTLIDGLRQPGRADARPVRSSAVPGDRRALRIRPARHRRRARRRRPALGRVADRPQERSVPRVALSGAHTAPRRRRRISAKRGSVRSEARSVSASRNSASA